MDKPGGYCPWGGEWDIAGDWPYNWQLVLFYHVFINLVCDFECYIFMATS